MELDLVFEFKVAKTEDAAYAEGLETSPGFGVDDVLPASFVGHGACGAKSIVKIDAECGKGT